MNDFLFNIYVVTTEVYIVISVCFLLVYGVFLSTFSMLGYPILNKNLSLLVSQTLIFSFMLAYSQQPLDLLSWNDFLVSDSFTYGSKLIILGSSISWILLTFQYTVYEKINSFEYWILILLAILAMIIIVQSFDILIIYLGIEFQSLIFYILASFKRNSEFSTEAGLKYFVLGAFASAFLLFGSSILYGLTGLTNLGDLSKFFSGILVDQTLFFIGVFLGFLFILIALLFKLSAAPFHMWAPDVYEGSPTSVTAFFSIMPKLAILAILFRILTISFHDFIPLWRNVVLFCAILSLLLGTLGAFSQTKWKRFFAYSSITHIGFFLLALLTGNFESISNAIFYIIMYVVMMFSIFSFIISLRIVKYPNHYQSRYLKDLDFLGETNPFLAYSMTLILFSMAGVPPLAGFFAKFLVLFTALQSHMFGASIFAILVSCIACFYYIRLIKDMYFGKLMVWPVNYPVARLNSLILGLSAGITLLVFLDIETVSIFSALMSSSF